MPKIAFLGFPAGPIRVKVAQAETVAEATIGDTTTTAPLPPPPPETTAKNPWGHLPPPSGAAVKLQVNRRVGTAPAGFFFSAVASGFEDGKADFDHYFDVRYKWTFEDAGWYTRHDSEDLPWGKYYEVDGKVVLVEDGRRPAGKSVRFLGNDKNVAYGPHVVHVFDRPGTYNVRCEVQRRGVGPLQSEPVQVVVEKADEVFAGPATVCVSPSGNFEGAPERALKVARLAEVGPIAAAGGEYLRVLLRRGEHHAVAKDTPDLKRSGGFRRLMYGAFGTGADPTWGPYRIKTDTNGPAGNEFVIWGLRRAGVYDPTDPWNTSLDTENAIDGGNAEFTTIWDCEFSGVRTPISFSGDAKNAIVGNTRIRDWHNYGVYSNKGIGYSGFCGVWIKQNAKAVIGPNKGENVAPFYQDHAPFRCSALNGPVAWNLADLRSVGSWAGYYQPCLRIGRSPYDNANIVIEEANMDRIRGENGSVCGTGASKYAVARRYLWDKIYNVVANESGGNSAMISCVVSGPHFRNVVGVLPNTPKLGGGRLRYWFRMPAETDNLHESIAQFGVHLYNITYVDLRQAALDDVVMTVGSNEGAMLVMGDKLEMANNLFWVPDPARRDHVISAGPLDVSVLWNVTNEGVRYQNDPFAAIYGYPPDTAARYQLLPAAAGVGTADPACRIAFDDFFGRPRPEKASPGALEPG